MENCNHWSRPSGAVFGTEGSVRAITVVPGDPIGNSFGQTGCKISAFFQISDDEWEEPAGGIGAGVGVFPKALLSRVAKRLAQQVAPGGIK